MLKLIGLSLILTASGAAGFGLAGRIRRQQVQTLALLDALLRLRHELQYRLTPLPEAFELLGESANAPIGAFFSRLSESLSGAQPCSVGYACRQALRNTPGMYLSAGTQRTILSLFDTLGTYDLDGNLQLLDLALARERDELRTLQAGAAARCRTYVTLGICTGLAVAVILL